MSDSDEIKRKIREAEQQRILEQQEQQRRTQQEELKKSKDNPADYARPRNKRPTKED